MLGIKESPILKPLLISLPWGPFLVAIFKSLLQCLFYEVSEIPFMEFRSSYPHTASRD
jgi:hypothetical protein